MANGEDRFIEAIADGEARQVLKIVNRSIVSGNSLTGKRDISGDLARGDLAVKNAVGGLDCKIVGSNNQRMQTVFSIASQGFENQPEKDLTGDGQNEKANATQDDEQAGKLFVAVKKHGDESDDVGCCASYKNSAGLSGTGEESLWSGQPVPCGNESPRDAGEEKQDYVGSPIGRSRRRRKNCGEEAEIGSDGESARRQKKDHALQNEFNQI
jgi:hypothetical protein